MWFLIEYDRKRGEVITLRRFEENERFRAENSRLDLELQLNRAGKQHEVVLLQASSEDALRRTHRRYFEDLIELAS